jgi:glycosyltransferase involved in cell wall biosynthesis
LTGPPEPIERVIGRGAIWPIRGTFAGRAASYFVQLGPHRETFPPTRDPAGPGLEGYFLPVALQHAPAALPVQVAAIERGGGVHPLRAFALTTRPRFAPEVPPGRLTAPVVIAMATYNPQPALLARQVASLQAQTYTDWQCLVRDDGSAPASFTALRRICAEDRRFIVVRDVRNRGFYGNFEHCLANIPESVEFVALCDQDDRWHPDKLARSLAAFDAADVELVYTDMRLVDEHGAVLAETFWVGRSHSSDPDAFLLNNTVTSAATVIRRRLLDYALPFPEDLGGHFHDHWIACVARARGRIRYLDEPLYDYTQHQGSVLGHEGFTAPTAGAELRWAVREGLTLLRNRSARRTRMLQFLRHHQQVYRKLELYRRTLLLRCQHLPPDLLAAFDCYQGRLLDAARLVLSHGLPARLRGSALNLEDVKLAAGLLLHRASGALRLRL